MRDLDVNPIIKSDYPDPDVIRIDDTYYMVSTTMHFLPGGVILRSYDLVNWEIVNYVYDELEDTSKEKMELESTNYGGGMWAASLRFHNGTFYVAFESHSTKKTYLFTSDDILGKWKKNEIDGYYHDCSLLFDDDRVFIVYGNGDIYLTELKSDLSGPLEGGVNKIIVSDVKGQGLGYEGSHFYKINGRYYLFLIHWLQSGNGRRTEACFVADSVDGEYVGRDVLDDDMGFFNQGVAQGGIVDTPNGKWFAVLFRDNGAVGRIPVLVPVKWVDNFPVFGNNGKVPKNPDMVGSRPYYRYTPVYTSDDFKYPVDFNGHAELKLQWQWNHRPDGKYWEILPEGGLKITTSKICANLTHTKNMLTQRCMYPRCEATVTVDASGLKNGDVAGLCILQGLYGLIGITKESGEYYLVKMARAQELYRGDFSDSDYLPGAIYEKIRVQSSKVTFCIRANFEDMTDKADFFYVNEKSWLKLGATQTFRFGLDHFCGARFGLFVFATKETGGNAVFSDFYYEYNI